jgi:methylated-DNA-protein-cysteine methyltransferase-like protein
MPPKNHETAVQSGENVFARILAVVRRIPRGRVASYGQVARLAGLPRHARHVGYALHGLPAGSAVPWHRVINARGAISLRGMDLGAADTQRLRLENEGVCFDFRGRVSFERHGWKPARETSGAIRSGRTRDQRTMSPGTRRRSSHQKSSHEDEPDRIRK